MKISSFDTGKDVFIIAEVGNNHEGSYALAEKLIYLAAEAGADAVKFQTYKTEDYISPKEAARFSRIKKFELSYEQFEQLSYIARKAGLLFLSTPFDCASVKFLNTIVPAFKISSGDNTFYPLLEAVAMTGKPIILSTGFLDLEGVRRAVSFIESVWLKIAKRGELAILHCVSSYPVAPSEANVRAITQLKQELPYTIGYSDHTLGIDAAILSVALGARIIEKHFTLDHDYSDFRDHKLSATPNELAQLVKKVKEASTLLGSGKKIPQAGEQALMAQFRRSIVAKRNLPAGTKITRDAITWVRLAGGLASGQEELLLGKIVSEPILAGDFLIPELLRDL